MLVGAHHAVQGELGDPDGSVAARRVRVRDVVLEVLGVGDVAVPVDGHEVDGAPEGLAGLHEAGQVSHAHTGRSRTVRHGWRTQPGLSGVLLHPLHVPVGGILNPDVGLLGEVRLVKGQEVRRAGGEGLGDRVVPATGGSVAVAPEHRHVLEGSRDSSVGAGPPVVAPGGLGAGADEGGQEGRIVVGQSTLGSGGRGWRWGPRGHRREGRGDDVDGRRGGEGWAVDSWGVDNRSCVGQDDSPDRSDGCRRSDNGRLDDGSSGHGGGPDVNGLQGDESSVGVGEDGDCLRDNHILDNEGSLASVEAASESLSAQQRGGQKAREEGGEEHLGILG